MKRSELVAFLQTELDAQRELHSLDGCNAVIRIIHKVYTEERFADTEMTDCGADGMKIQCKSCNSVLQTVTHKSGRMESGGIGLTQNLLRDEYYPTEQPHKTKDNGTGN